jgi:hypothetical protein
MARPRHPVKELEWVLRTAELRGWRVTRGKKYFKMKCSCPRMCIKTVHLSPSDPKYAVNLIGYLTRTTCWTE